MEAVELKNVVKKYGSRTVLKDISFSVKEGELLALVGPSGCGKSTLLNMIGVLETFDAGSIQVFGKRTPKIKSHGATLMRRNMVNYLFQSFALISDLTICQNLFLSMNFLDIPKQEKLVQIERVLESVNLAPLKNSVVNTLSGGEQQRVALARTLLKPGKLILADEPTGSLDTGSAEVSFSLIQSLCKENNKTVIMVTHSPELAQRADRIIDLNMFK